jgi:lysophospholipase L1-like esterase
LAAASAVLPEAGGGRSTFTNRATVDLAALSTPLTAKRDAVLVYGGTNDSTSGLQAAAAASRCRVRSVAPSG